MAIVLMVGFQRGYSEKLRLLGEVAVTWGSCRVRGELRSVSEFFGPHKVINFVTLAELLPEP